MTKAIELAELTRTIIDSVNATAITINSSEQVTFAEDIILADSKKLYLVLALTCRFITMVIIVLLATKALTSKTSGR